MKQSTQAVDSSDASDALSIAKVACARACDNVYDIYRDMCRAMKGEGAFDSATVLEQLQASVLAFESAQRIASGQPVNENG